MKTELFIARRLGLAGAGHKSSPAIKVAIISTALSVAIMLLAVSVVTGFRSEIRDKITGFDAHISLYPAIESEEEDPVINYTPELRQLLESRPYISHADLLVTAPVLLKTSEAFKGLYLKGVEPGYDFRFLSSNLEAGRTPSPANKSDILISRAAATKLGVQAGDSVNLFMSDDLRARKVKVSGVFNTHFSSYDQYFAYGSASLVRELTGLESSQGSAIDITTTDFNRLREYTPALVQDLNTAIKSGRVLQGFNTSTALDKGANFFAWLDLLDLNVVVILVLMTLVALFTLISGMLTIILERIRIIGIMRSIGARRRQIRRVFILLAIRVGLTGMLIGNGLALAIILLQRHTHFIPLDADTYYIDFVPVTLNGWHFLAVNAAFIMVVYLALILPSQFAARIKPSQTLRFDF